MMINLLKSSLIILLFTLTPQVKGKNLSGLEIVSESLPYEVELMIKHLKQSALDQEEQDLLVANLDLINDDLGSLDKKTLMFLFKSEIYKGILTNQYLKLDDKVQFSQSTLSTINLKLEKHKVIYSNFSSWSIQSIYNDIFAFSDNNFLNRYQNINRSNPKETLMAKKLNKVLKYVSPLLFAFLSLSPERYNHLSKNIILDTFSRISKKSFYFKSLYFKGSSSKDVLFKLPTISLSVRENPAINETSLRIDAEKEKKAAEVDIKNLDNSDLSPISSKIDEIIPNN